jgi:solute carrier family 25 folate transporter 32
MKKFLADRRGKRSQSNVLVPSSHFENFGAACASGSIMVFITNPIWLIKTRMQLQLKRTQEAMIKKMPVTENMNAPYRNVFDAARIIVKEEGPFALYKGTIPALLLTSHGGVQFVVYEFLKKEFKTQSFEGSKSSQDRMISIEDRLRNSVGFLVMGGCSKVVASTVTFPLQTIKARIQQRAEGVEIMNSGEVVLIKRTKYNGVIDCIHGIWKNEGLRGFFKGCIPNALRVAPSSAVTFVVYEAIIDVFRSFEKYNF